MLVDSAVLDKVPAAWRTYLGAKLGFKNHWDPVPKSGDAKEGEPQPVKLLGDPVLLNRVDGVVYALRDRCLHRGVPFFKKLQCFTPDTLTCWYHAWTYSWRSGEAVQILSDPRRRQSGKQHLRSYPVEEANGLVFVLVGDATDEPPDLALDVPPGFLDTNRVGFSEIRTVQSNWRVGAENGLDGGTCGYTGIPNSSNATALRCRSGSFIAATNGTHSRGSGRMAAGPMGFAL